MVEVKQVRDINQKLDYQLREANVRLEASYPTIIQEQKELIIELKQRVMMLNRELILITKNTSDQMADLKKKNLLLINQATERQAI